jgi:hypothetical protein
LWNGIRHFASDEKSSPDKIFIPAHLKLIAPAMTAPIIVNTLKNYISA